MMEEFDRQVEVLLQKGYSKNILSLVKPLRNQLTEITNTLVDYEHGHLPFVIVIKNELLDGEIAMRLVEREGIPGLSKLFPLSQKDFIPIDSIEIPDSQAYLLIDIDRGKKYLNVRPHDAMKLIINEERSPLTITEGIALVTQHPNFLMKNNCFSLLASRHPGDKKVPAIWINGKKQPNLGWCWDGNPHTWLGSASCKIRIGCELEEIYS